MELKRQGLLAPSVADDSDDMTLGASDICFDPAFVYRLLDFLSWSAVEGYLHDGIAPARHGYRAERHGEEWRKDLILYGALSCCSRRQTVSALCSWIRHRNGSGTILWDMQTLRKGGLCL